MGRVLVRVDPRDEMLQLIVPRVPRYFRPVMQEHEVRHGGNTQVANQLGNLLDVQVKNLHNLPHGRVLELMVQVSPKRRPWGPEVQQRPSASSGRGEGRRSDRRHRAFRVHRHALIQDGNNFCPKRAASGYTVVR